MLQSPLCFYGFIVLQKAVLSLRDSHNLMLYLDVTLSKTYTLAQVSLVSFKSFLELLGFL